MATVPIALGARLAATAARRILMRHAGKLLERQVAVDALFADEDLIYSDRTAQLQVLCGVSLKEQDLSHALQEHCSLAAFRIAQGHEISYEEMFRDINQIAEDHGFLSGVLVLLPGDDQPDLVMAEGVPLAEIFRMNQDLRRAQRAQQTEMQEDLTRRAIPVRNSWHVLGDRTVCVIDTDEGPMAWPQSAAGLRLRKLVHGIEVRHHAHQSAEAEFRAMESLRPRVSKNQFDSYVLSGAFPERSPRSGLFYYFRKGLPTLAVTYHGKYSESGRVLCALCLHPMGYYAGTHVGLMTPTDEVIAHLLMMRADEHAFWKKSGQWAAEDTRSGI
jgi:hypothetical protein